MAYKTKQPKERFHKDSTITKASNVFSMTYGKPPTEKELDDLIDV
jgi:hypothetical protein